MMNEVRSKGRFGIWLSILIPSVLVFVCIVLELVLAQPVHAAVFNIVSGDVTGLINAINTANSNGQDNTINLAAGTYTLTAVDNNTDGSNGLPSITSNITINGAGANNTIIIRDASASTPDFRIFHVAASATLTLDGLTIRGGFVVCFEDMNHSDQGGGIFNNGGIVNVDKCTLSDNAVGDLPCNFSAGDPGGAGVFNNAGIVNISNSTISGNNIGANEIGGGIENESGMITITNSSISGNFGDNFTTGGGIFNTSGTMNFTNSIIAGNSSEFCAGIANFGTMTLTNSTISDNIASSLEGGFVGGICNDDSVNIINSAITFNSGGFTGGGIRNRGTATITNSTIANNFGDAGIVNFGTVTITNSTIVDNTSDQNSGGILNDTGGTVQLQNTILALNTGEDVFLNQVNSDCSGQVTSLGNNIIGDTTGCTITLQSTDLTGNPGLGAFTDNGSPGNGHFPLLSNSRAINAGNNAVCLANLILATDQIGDPRVGICDIGSIEFEPFKNLGECVSTLIQQNCSGLQGQSRAACNHEQQTFCFNLFKSK